MARSTYLGTASDMLLVKRGASLSASSKAGVLRFWDAETGGTQHTDLLLNGAAVTEVPVPAGTLIAPAVELPDGVDGGAWVEWVLDGETTADSRELITPSRPLTEAKAHTDATVAGLVIPSTAADVGADPAGTAQGLVDALKANAPAAYDTLVEIATKLNADDDVTAQLLADVADKVDTADLDTLVATEIDTPGSETRTRLSASFVPLAPASQVDELTAPYVIAHMGAKNLAPEETMAAFGNAVAVGCRVIEFDVHKGIDGSLLVMHDQTLDRTTTSTGSVLDQTGASWQNLSIDSAGLGFGSLFPDQKPPLLTDVLSVYANRIIMCIEAKSAGSGQPLADELVRFGAQRSTIVGSAFMDELAPAAAAGIACMFVDVAGTTQTPAALVAAGVGWVAADYTQISEATIGALQAVGIKVVGYTLNRQSNVDTFMAKGADGWISDDPIYSAGAYTDYAYRLDEMPWSAQAFYHGHIAGSANKRGVFTAPDGWGFDDTVNAGARTVLAGAICPIKGDPDADTYTIDFSFTVESQTDTGRWMGGYICCPDDRAFNDNGASAGVNGYRWLIAGNGTMQVGRYTNGVIDSTLISTPTVAFALPGEVVTGQLIVTPTAITIRRTDVGPYEATANWAEAQTYRGGYCHLAATGTTGRFTRWEVTA